MIVRPKVTVSEINIEEYRGIKRCHDPLKLSKFNVLIGRNNSGKSSILEALSLLPYPQTNQVDFMIPALDKSKEKFIEELHSGRTSLIYKYSGEAKINYKALGHTVDIILKDNKTTEFIGDGNPISSTIMNDFIKFWNFGKDIRNIVVLIPNDTDFLKNLAKGLAKQLHNNVVKSGAHISVWNNIISKTIDDRYTEFFFSPELKARKEPPEGLPYYVDVQDLGDGVKKIALIGLWVEVLSPFLILWDDLEASVHPSLVKSTLEWLSSRGWQVVLSTHSIDILNSLLEVRPDDTKIIQLSKGNDDILHHKDQSLDDIQTMFDANNDPRKTVDLLRL